MAISEALTLAIINGIFQLAEVGVQRADVLRRVDGVPADKIPEVLDAMFAESKVKRDAAIAAMPADK